MLDDTLSAVDHTTEMRLVEELSRDRGGGATTLIVSHRISALRASDQILVMDGGRLVATVPMLSCWLRLGCIGTPTWLNTQVNPLR